MEVEHNSHQEGMLENFCPPSLNNLSNFTDPTKYYASDLLNLNTPTEDQLLIFEQVHNPTLSTENRLVATNILRNIQLLFKLDDHCDKLGVNYLLKIGEFFHPNSKHYENIPHQLQLLLKEDLYNSSKKLPAKVKEYFHK